MKSKKIIVNESQFELIKENIKISKGEKGKHTTCQAAWENEKDCPTCGGKAFYCFTISDGGKGRGKLKVTDENGNEIETEIMTLAIYYCPHCMRFHSFNNMA